MKTVSIQDLSPLPPFPWKDGKPGPRMDPGQTRVSLGPFVSFERKVVAEKRKSGSSSD